MGWINIRGALVGPYIFYYMKKVFDLLETSTSLDYLLYYVSCVSKLCLYFVDCINNIYFTNIFAKQEL